MNALAELAMEPPAGISRRDQSDVAPSPYPRMRLRKVLVPLDLSRQSANELRYALRVITKLGGTPVLLHVNEPTSFLSSTENVLLTLSEAAAAKDAHHRLERLSHKVIEPPGCAETLISIGRPVSEITEAARTQNADMVILTTHGFTGFRQAIHASIAERVVRESPCPVLTINKLLIAHQAHAANCPGGINWRRILVVADLVQSAMNGLLRAVALSIEPDTEVTLLHVGPIDSADPKGAPIDEADLQDEVRQFEKQYPHIKINFVLPSQRAAERSGLLGRSIANVIVQTARRLVSDVVVMGKPDYPWWQTLGHASAVERVVRTAPCQVLSIPEYWPPLYAAHQTNFSPMAHSNPKSNDSLSKMKNHHKRIVRPSVQSVLFEFYHATATAVFIAGTFNDWKPETTPMVPLGDGRWHKDLVLAPGVYEYRLVVDGDWLLDPNASATTLNPFGGLNSVIEVAAGTR